MISAIQLQQLFTPTEIIGILKKGIRAYGAGEYYIPQRMHLEQEDMTYLLMPAISQRFFCTKLVSVIPKNKEKNLPIIQGVLVLNERATGAVRATMEAPMITALRTAAVGAIGLELISLPNTQKIGVIGCGVQGFWQSVFAQAIRPVRQIYAHSKTYASFEAYQSKLNAQYPDLEVIWCERAEVVVQAAEVIYACTNANTPLFPNEESLVKNKQFISVGSFQKDMQELPDVVYQQADLVLLDTMTAKEEVGDIIFPLQKGILKEDQLLSLSSALNLPEGNLQKKTIVFKSVGMAAFDLALAVAVYEKKQKVKG
ncbi:MAG: ornithine cyclodeaminase family protein [Bacteroidota bacterium]